MMSINNDIIVLSKKWILIVLVSACVLEAIFFFSEENLYGCFSLIYGWLLVSKLIFNRNNINKFPLATIAVSMLGFCYYFLPLIITLVEGKPLTFNFQVPFLTFSNQIISITVICLSFKVATSLYRPDCMLNRLWNKIGYMSILSERQVWCLGLIGFFALLLQILSQGQEYEYSNTGNFKDIVIESISYFSVAPVCLLFNNLYGDKSQITTRRYVIIYIVVLALLGIATTRRALIFNCALNIVFMYLFIVIYNNKRIFTTKNTLILLLAFYFVTGPLADMATAMILNRQLVKETSASKTFEQVWDLYKDKEKLRDSYNFFMALKDNGGNNQYGWSEYYVDNIFLDRFCNLRTIDGTLYNAQKAGFGCNEGQRYFENFWIKEIPSFVANALGKKKDFQGTATDHMVVSNFGEGVYYYTGYKVGGETGIGLWMFGYSYYFIAFLIYIFVFYFLCSFVNYSNSLLLLPFPILVEFRKYWLFFLNANGIFSSMNFTFARNNLNTIMIYCVLLIFLKLIIRK